MMKNISSAVHWFAKRTSMHGIPSLVHSKTPKSKLFWTLVCMTAMGMFFYMFMSLILKYQSCPLVTKVSEMPRGILLPNITFCSGNFITLMDEISYADLVKKEQESTPASVSNSTAEKVYHTLRNMNRLHIALASYGKNRNINVDLSDDQHKMLMKWSKVARYFNERWLIDTLLVKDVGSLEDLNKGSGGPWDQFLVYCSNGGIECDRSYIQYNGGLHDRNCYTYQPVLPQGIAESAIQGIENGVTFIFWTGSSLLASEFGTEKFWLLNGYKNTMDPSLGSDNVRVIIHDGSHVTPNLEGIDISSGMATMLGVTSRESTLQPGPCGVCSDVDHEAEHLKRLVRSQSKYKLLERSFSAYNGGICRLNCLIRRIWMKCGCLQFHETLPIFNSSLLCGQTKHGVFQTPFSKGSSDCFTIETIFRKDCGQFLQKMLDQLVCVQNVLAMEFEDSVSFSCDCPASCYTVDYQVSYSASRWPRPGPDLDATYKYAVLDGVIPHLETLNSSLTEGPISYLSNHSNRYEIMEDFAKLTVYIKSMRVERVEQLKAYTPLDLLSDIGGQLGLWVGISAITLCEISAFVCLFLKSLCCVSKDKVKNKDGNNENQTQY